MFGGFFGRNAYYDQDEESSDDERPSTSAAAREGNLEPSAQAARLAAFVNAEDDAAEATASTLPAATRRGNTHTGIMAMPIVVASEDMDIDIDVEAQHVEGMCIECGDQPAALFCEQCQDDFCDVCFAAMHKRGHRKHHVTKKVTKSASASSSMDEKKEAAFMQHASEPATVDSAVSMDPELSATAMIRQQELKAMAMEATTSNFDPDRPDAPSLPLYGQHFGNWFLERAKYIPLRLTLAERKKLRLVEATLTVSEYTDKVDVISYKNKALRIHAQLREVCAILSGLMVAHDYKQGQQLVKDFEFKHHAEFFHDMFEIGRRHKIRNPEKMRGAYGKLVYLLQDSQAPEIQEMLEFKLVRKIRTVHSLLQEHDALDALQDKLLPIATGAVNPAGKNRSQIDKEIRMKDKALDMIASKYAKPDKGLSEDDVKQAILSINDNHNYLINNRDSCDRMIYYLTKYFKPDTFEQSHSLAILGGRSGARLTHSHTMQYHYVLQSLTLWREILHDMFRLWYLCEEDLLNEENAYRLRNTGQGMNRIQYAPLVGRAMSNIIHRVQSKVGSWVGSSVVHLGDHNVPNALMFIDKYNQVSRILNPIVITLNHLPAMYEKPDLKYYIDNTFGGIEACTRLILTDFFRHAFDGSGADNFFDAGSCIDGRLTSAWHWCSQIEKKSYYHIFVLAGFQGFDGKFE